MTTPTQPNPPVAPVQLTDAEKVTRDLTAATDSVTLIHSLIAGNANIQDTNISSRITANYKHLELVVVRPWVANAAAAGTSLTSYTDAIAAAKTYLGVTG